MISKDLYNNLINDITKRNGWIVRNIRSMLVLRDKGNSSSFCASRKMTSREEIFNSIGHIKTNNVPRPLVKLKSVAVRPHRRRGRSSKNHLFNLLVSDMIHQRINKVRWICITTSEIRLSRTTMLRRIVKLFKMLNNSFGNLRRRRKVPLISIDFFNMGRICSSLNANIQKTQVILTIL
ncbi:hypothetical protein KFK09_010070 [Dendrobium nobile]|uniref:Uncharacterized protein n=1 Tax=Dendrobium nobile TaxID=94219 RepID=A0A8T3BMU4_DENNO|nr:hypothetical protein KFK09_010062 [Dendrobium nobile]KAI0514036.1 hypothetical protein KFK09_010070 [Dendrobium nobile]